MNWSISIVNKYESVHGHHLSRLQAWHIFAWFLSSFLTQPHLSFFHWVSSTGTGSVRVISHPNELVEFPLSSQEPTSGQGHGQAQRSKSLSKNQSSLTISDFADADAGAGFKSTLSLPFPGFHQKCRPLQRTSSACGLPRYGLCGYSWCVILNFISVGLPSNLWNSCKPMLNYCL